VRRVCRIALAVVWVAGASFLGTGAPAAQEPRFLPWKAATPELELRDLSGERRTLADYRGRVVLVNFWATWCEFCKDEVASMKRLQEHLAGRPLAILMVNYGESPTRARAYAKGLTADVRVLLDPEQDTARAWKVRVIPSSFVVDTRGQVRYSVIGNVDWSGEEAVRILRELLP
jgi:thiol-disulfide isomerase/thioredoxin